MLHAITADPALVKLDLNRKFGSKFFPVKPLNGAGTGTSCEKRTELTLIRAHTLIYTPPTP